MPDISLTDFVDFATTTPPSQLTKVRQLCSRGVYDPRFDWFKPPSAVWSYGGLNVRVNPELGLQLGGKKHIIKLYFKDEKPTKQRLKVVFEMMRIGLALDSTVAAAVLDVSNGKLIVPKPLPEDLLPLLEAQALTFVHLWNAIVSKNAVAL